MRLGSKLFFVIGAILLASLAGTLYNDARRTRAEFESDLVSDARAVQDMVMALRQVYIKQFVASGLPVTDKTIGFLPAHATPRIARAFMARNGQKIYFNTVSDKPRNPDNRADALEMQAIRYFREHDEETEFITRYNAEDGQPTYQFAAPIWVKKACLKCHGDPADAPPSIRDRYADAYGYQLGDLRGVLSIKLPASALQQRLGDHQQAGFIQYSIVFVLLMAGLGLALRHMILRRLDRLRLATANLRSGSAFVPIDLGGRDEISDLGDNFNRMGLTIAKRERELQERESLQRAVIESAQDAIVIGDTEGRVLMFNPVACKLFGYKTEEIIGQSLTVLMPERFRQAHNDGMARLQNTGEPHLLNKPAVQLMAQHRDGSEFPIEMSLGHGSGHQGSVYVATIRDISDRKRIETDLRLAATAFESLSAMAITDARGTILRVNQAFTDITGYSAEEVVGRNPRILQSGRQSDEFYQRMWQQIGREGHWQGEIWNRRKNGEIYPEWLSIAAVRNRSGQTTHYVGTFNDLSKLHEQRETIARLAEEERVIGLLMRQAAMQSGLEAFLQTSLELLLDECDWIGLLPTGGIYLINENQPDQLSLMASRGISAQDDLCQQISSTDCTCQPASSGGRVAFVPPGGMSGQTRFAGSEENARYCVPIRAHRQIIGVLTLFLPAEHQPSDAERGFLERIGEVLSIAVTRRQAEAQIEHQAYHDALTGLPNRRMLQDLLRRELSISQRQQLISALLFIDLDHFKHLNDSLGHSVGDELLVQVAERLTGQLRAGDIVARLGGDEFVVLLPALGKEETSASQLAQQVSEKLCTEIGRVFQLGEHRHRLTASIGIALLPGDEASVDDILKRADAAMYLSKTEGRNRVSFYQPHLQAAADERLFIETELRQAIERDELQLVFQPQVDGNGRLFGAEVLLRWQHHERGFISPGQFIPVAEDTDLILDLGDWVIDAACRQLRDWRATDQLGSLQQLAINISPAQFAQPDFADKMQQAVRRHQIPPQLLDLELTEGIAVQDIDDVIGRMAALRELGFSFSMDDFGTGYSSLAYLKRLPMDVLKIDQSFVHDVDQDAMDAAVVETIISMARFLELDVIAEGVETEAELQFLLEHGCDNFQGYYFSRPLPLEEFSEWLSRDERTAEA